MSDNDILFDSKFADEVRRFMESRGYITEHFGEGHYDVYLKKPVSNFEMHTALFGSDHDEKMNSYYEDTKSRLIKDDNNKTVIVYKLWISCVGMGLNNLDDSKEGIDRFLKRNPETCFVVENQNKIVGVIIAGNDGRRGYIYHTAVLPEYRKQEIAAKLVARLILEE